jgi:hypothetical protein
MGFFKDLFDRFKKKKTIKKTARQTDSSKNSLGSSISSNKMSETQLRGQDRSEYVRNTIEENKSTFPFEDFFNRQTPANGTSKVNPEAVDNELGAVLRKRQPSK